MTRQKDLWLQAVCETFFLSETDFGSKYAKSDFEKFSFKATQ